MTWADGSCGMFEGATPFNQPVAGKEGLQRPLLASGDPVTGSNKKVFRKECKRKRVRAQEDQPQQTYWSMSSPGQELKESFRRERPAHVGGMCPAGLALKHPASDTLMEWATEGCPVETGKNWGVEELQAAVDKGPHKSAMNEQAMMQHQQEVQERLRSGQAVIVLWDDIKADPPKNRKVHPFAMIPHKTRYF